MSNLQRHILHDDAEEKQKNVNMVPLEIRYQAAMVLSGVGDCLGYKNGAWLQCTNGLHIYKELRDLGGVNNLSIKPPDWKVSACTMANIRTGRALMTENNNRNIDSVIQFAARNLHLDYCDMENRDPDEIYLSAREKLDPNTTDGCISPFDAKGVTSLVAVKGISIGLRHPNAKEVENLIEVSIELGRMTHHHPTGYLGTLTVALFTSYALRKKPAQEWAIGLLEALPKAMEYIKKRKISVEENANAWNEFTDKWQNYVKLTGIEVIGKAGKFQDQSDLETREEFYKSFSANNHPGSTACDAAMIAYDAILGYDGSWEDLCRRSLCHGGNSNITCSIALCWYGAMYGFEGVNKCNYAEAERSTLLRSLGRSLHNICGFIQPTKNILEKPRQYNTRTIYLRKGKSTDTFIDLQVAEIRKDPVSDESLKIGETIYSHICSFFEKVGTGDPSCKVSEILKVGSFYEGTKIHLADEFDFIAILSVLSKPGVFTLECSNVENGSVSLFLHEDVRKGILAQIPDKQLQEDKKPEFPFNVLMETICLRLYNTVLSDRNRKNNIDTYHRMNQVEWMPLPVINGIEMSVRFCEARLPNMIWEFLYKNRRISVDVTLAVRYNDVEKCYKQENASVPEIGKAVVQKGSVLLVGYNEILTVTVTETEVEYVRNRLQDRHKKMYSYLKFFNYKYGKVDILTVSGVLPFSSYMLKSICIYHDLRCTANTEDNETCLRDIVDIMEESLTKGYMSAAETLNETVIGYLPSVFNRSRNLYREPHKPVDRLKALRNAMVEDLKTIHLSGRKWSNTEHILIEISERVAESTKKVCDQIWSDSDYLLMVKK